MLSSKKQISDALMRLLSAPLTNSMVHVLTTVSLVSLSYFAITGNRDITLLLTSPGLQIIELFLFKDRKYFVHPCISSQTYIDDWLKPGWDQSSYQYPYSTH